MKNAITSAMLTLIIGFSGNAFAGPDNIGGKGADEKSQGWQKYGYVNYGVDEQNEEVFQNGALEALEYVVGKKVNIGCKLQREAAEKARTYEKCMKHVNAGCVASTKYPAPTEEVCEGKPHEKPKTPKKQEIQEEF